MDARALREKIQFEADPNSRDREQLLTEALLATKESLGQTIPLVDVTQLVDQSLRSSDLPPVIIEAVGPVSAGKSKWCSELRGERFFPVGRNHQTRVTAAISTNTEGRWMIGGVEESGKATFLSRFETAQIEWRRMVGQQPAAAEGAGDGGQQPAETDGGATESAHGGNSRIKNSSQPSDGWENVEGDESDTVRSISSETLAGDSSDVPSLSLVIIEVGVRCVAASTPGFSLSLLSLFLSVDVGVCVCVWVMGGRAGNLRIRKSSQASKCKKTFVWRP
uniref:Uncharacterized protein n=1 Tax=Chromera velia CCMP2878 TaxID=1169474 RepID=A0A0G4G404_9ALVE|eukprot:Cvel_20012.t1-p1 / transcript=Cvel_20012.t1 / gene=Cvel_20012 / organism=Chromera_velia_CCMP2878 / gene_product=hypothetical protein / transcript_product=hypothetical protein / location=Cvel_scaffold1765:14975-15805(-) / protein_length=277 / sequence_SO=supercontig / SO=protein_coding / is_pseudo=false